MFLELNAYQVDPDQQVQSNFHELNLQGFLKIVPILFVEKTIERSTMKFLSLPNGVFSLAIRV